MLKNLVAAIDTPGGHMLLGFLCIPVGVWVHWFGLSTQGDMIITGGFTAMAMGMKGQNGGKLSITPGEAGPKAPPKGAFEVAPENKL